MAHITLAGTLLDPTSELAVGDQVRFTHKSTTGETIKSAVSLLTIPPTGDYSIDLQYGLVLVEYKDVRKSQFKNLGVATVNQDNPATSIPELLNALVPVSSAELIEFQAILADCVAAQAAAEAAASLSEAFAGQLTTLEIIASSQIYAADVKLNASGFDVSGDGGGGSWVQNGVTGQTPSQSPAQLADNLLNDANGNQWALVTGQTLNYSGTQWYPLPFGDSGNGGYLFDASGWVYISVINDLSQAYEFATLNDAIISTINFPVGKVLKIKERTAGNGGGGEWVVNLLSAVTVPAGSPLFGFVVASTGAPTLALVNDFKNKISTRAFGLIPDYNPIGDTGTNNVDAWKAIHVLIDTDKLHGVHVNVDGDHLIEYDNATILEAIPGGNNTAKIIEGVDRLRFMGSGLIRYKKPITERVWLACFKDCQNPVWMVREINGGFVPTSSTTITSSQHGPMFWACENPHMNRARVHKIDGAPVSFTSYPATPATEVGTSTDCYLTKCNFNYFEQCSTFGGASLGVHVTGNSFRNNWLSAFKFSSNIELAAGPVAKIGQGSCTDNTCLWDDDFQVPFDTSGVVRCEVVGIMQQGPMETLALKGNIIDLSTIPTAQIVNSLPRALKIFGDDRVETIGNPAYMMRKLSITGNTLVADKSTSQCLRVTPLCRDIVITDNPYIVGVVELFTSNPFTARGDRFLFARNGMKVSDAIAPEIRVQSANFDKVIIEDIAMQGGSVKFSNDLLIGELHIGKLTDCDGVFMQSGGDRIDVEKVYISDSTPKAIDIAFRNLEKLSITDNTLATDGTAYKFDLDTDAIVSFNGNTAYGDVGEACSVGLDLNRGKLMVRGSNLNASTFFSLGAAVEVIQGDLLGVGAPAFAATIRRGVTMVDVGTGDRYAYIAGAWKLATYV